MKNEPENGCMIAAVFIYYHRGSEAAFITTEQLMNKEQREMWRILNKSTPAEIREKSINTAAKKIFDTAAGYNFGRPPKPITMDEALVKATKWWYKFNPVEDNQ